MVKNKDNIFDYQDYYNQDAERSNMITDVCPNRKYQILRRFQTIVNLIPKGKHINVLDVGCGDGVFLKFLANYGFQLSALEISKKRVERANKYLTQHNIKANIMVGDINNIPLKDESFDIIVAAEVIEHVIEPIKALKELKRVLKQNGVLIVSVPYKENIRFDQCIHCGKLTPRDGHLHSFDIPKIKHLVKEVSLYIGKIQLCLSLKTPGWGRIGKLLPFYIWNFLDRFFTNIGDEANWLVFQCLKKEKQPN